MSKDAVALIALHGSQDAMAVNGIAMKEGFKIGLILQRKKV